MSGAFPSSRDQSSKSRPNIRKIGRHRKSASGKTPPVLALVERACNSVVENLEKRQMLSATNDGFTASWFGGDNTSIAAFQAVTPNTNQGDFTSHYDVLNYEPNADGGAETVLPPDADPGFNPNFPANQGSNMSAVFTTNVVVGATGGFFTFYPTTDDGTEIDINGTPAYGSGTPIGAQNLGVGRGYAEDTDSVGALWAAGSTHEVQMYYNNGGGGWGYQLRWSAGTTAGATDLISKQLMTNTSGGTAASIQAPAPFVPWTSQVATGYTPPVPAQVANTTNSITISWSGHDLDAASFIVERGTSPTGPFTPLAASLANPTPATPTANGADGGTSYFDDTTATTGHSYYYVVVSNSIQGQVAPGVAGEPASPPSAALTVAAGNTALVPLPPDVNASAGGNVILIPEILGATEYNVLRATTAAGPFTAINATPIAGSFAVTSLSYTDTGTNANDYYEVQAIDGDIPNTDPAYSANSTAGTLIHGQGFGATYYPMDITPTAIDIATPYQPTVPAPAGSYSTIIPTINSGAQNNTIRPPYTPTTFNIGQGAGNQGNAFSTEFDFTVVAPTTEQYTFLTRTDDGFQLTVDGSVQGYAGYRGVSTPDVLPVVDNVTGFNPPTPSNNGLNTANGDAVTWTAGSTHTIQMAWENGGGGWEADLAWTSPSLAVTSPSFNGINGVVVPGFDAQPAGSATTFGTAVSATAADAPAIVTPIVGNQAQANLLWTSSEAATYTVFQSSTSGQQGTLIDTVNVTPGAIPGPANYAFTAAGLTQNSTYYFTVVATNANGTATSVQVPYTAIPVAPPAPTGVTATLGNFSAPLQMGGPAPTVDNVILKWNGSSIDTSYTILRAPVVAGVAGTFTQIATNVPVTGLASSYTDTTALIGSAFQYEVIANDSIGPSPASAPSNTVHLDTGALEEYYQNTTYGGATDNGDTHISGLVGSTPFISSLQPNINYNNNDPNVPPGGTRGNNYSVIFTGKVTVTTGGNYEFFESSDDDGVLYVDGVQVANGTWNSPADPNAAGATGGSGNAIYGVTGGTDPVLALNPGTYDYQFFMEEGGGGERFEMYENGPDAGVSATNPTGFNAEIIPTTNLAPLTGAPAAPTDVAATVGTQNGNDSNYSVSIGFTDNADNEFEYQVQRSTDAAFDAAGNVLDVAASGFIVNGQPLAGGAVSPVTGNSLLDNTAAPGQTYWYRVVGKNFEGTVTSAASKVTIPGTPIPASGVLANYYSNEWWDSAGQTTAGISTGGGTDSQSPVTLTSDESTILETINGAGSDTSAGSLDPSNGGAQSGVKFPDPSGVIGPDNFSDVFTGQINITTAGTYTFFGNTDDDGYVYVNDQLVSSFPGGHGGTGTVNTGGQTSFPISLPAGENNVQFFESNGGGGWLFQLNYDGPDTANTMVAAPGGQLVAQGGSGVLTPTSGAVLAPTDVSISNGKLSWNANGLNTAAIRYVIQRSSDIAFDGAGGVTTFDAGLPPGSLTKVDSYTNNAQIIGGYYYRIAAQNFGGTSPFSTPILGTVPATATQDVNNAIEVSFPAGGASITGYTLSRLTNGSGATAVQTFAPGQSAYSFTDTGPFTSGNTYTYQLTTGGVATTSTSNPVYYVLPTVVNHATGFTGETDLTLNPPQPTPAVTPLAPPDVLANGHLELTTNVANEANTAFETTPVGINSDFSTSFDFQITNPGADGFTFAIQGTSPTAVGGAGGSLGLSGITPSLAVVFNQYNGVSTTGLAVNGTIPAQIDMSGGLGNAFHNLNASGQTDVIQVSLNYQSSTETLFESVRDTTTGLGFSTSYNLSGTGAYANYLLGAGSKDYVGFTGGTGGANSTQDIFDWAFNDASSAILPGQPSALYATQDTTGKVQVSFSGPPTNGVAGITYQVMKSTNGGAYSAVGSPIANTGAGSYTLTDTGPFVNGSSYQYEAIIVGSTPLPPAPALSNVVYYIFSPVVTETPFAAGDLGTTLTSNTLSPTDSATITASNQLQLTDSTNGDDNSVFTTNPLTLGTSWQTSFDFEITAPGADGFVFTIQNNNANALGGGGGQLGYVGIANSIGVVFNQYNGVTQTALAAGGAVGPYIDMSTTLGNAFHNTAANNTTDTFQVSLAFNGTSGNLYEVVRDTANGKGYANTFTPAYYSQFGVTQAQLTALFATPVYVGFTAATGGANSTQTINDWVFNTATPAAVAPTVVSVTAEDGSGNGVAAGSAAKGQRSMETQIAVKFSEPVTLGAGAFALDLVNNYGSGTNNAAPDTALASILGTPSTPDGGVTWIIPILNNTTNSYALKGTGGGISGASLKDGVYDLHITSAAVTSGTATLTTYSPVAWHRLFGDLDNDRRTFNTDYAAFPPAFTNITKAAGATNYNQDLDVDGDGKVFTTDYSAFLGEFSTTRPFSEPQV